MGSVSADSGTNQQHQRSYGWSY